MFWTWLEILVQRNITGKTWERFKIGNSFLASSPYSTVQYFHRIWVSHLWFEGLKLSFLSHSFSPCTDIYRRQFFDYKLLLLLCRFNSCLLPIYWMYLLFGLLHTVPHFLFLWSCCLFFTRDELVLTEHRNPKSTVFISLVLIDMWF